MGHGTFPEGHPADGGILEDPVLLQKTSLGGSAKLCYSFIAFVALVTPLDSFEGAASSHLPPLFAVRLEAVEKHK
jgi:hypothetical protein